MTNNFYHPVVSVGTVNFLEGLATNAVTAVNALPGCPPVNSRRYFIRAISVLAVEQIGPTFLFYSSLTGQPTVAVDTNNFIGHFGFVDGMAVRLAGAGLFYYYVDGLQLPYFTETSGSVIGPPALNVALLNTSATAKTAGAPGAVRARFWLQPMGQ